MVTCTSGGVDPLYMGIGPVEAIPKALKQAGQVCLKKYLLILVFLVVFDFKNYIMNLNNYDTI